ncbi:ankyrin repeat-containing domain protein [Achaetomium macrosporum]|uniref:Ankyrin repeat-containing domain protein n=1 Tax=Achaetomium macrosporum TaxID=79813 RepID=A0AAN7C3D4_9PEZI|nr:ankyrin repeat-containing domain protein [Achaetomium macrosporum]
MQRSSAVNLAAKGFRCCPISSIYQDFRLHANGNPLVDISKVSRLLYLDYDSQRTWSVSCKGGPARKTVVYFEFDEHDSRYNTISSLLLYLLNAIAWRFWEGSDYQISVELAFLRDVHSWSFEPLFHLYSSFRRAMANELTIFISRFDQCPAELRRRFLELVLEEQSYNDSDYRLILSTLARDDLAVASFPDEPRINLEDSPAANQWKDSMAQELRSGLSTLLARRPIYYDLRPQLEGLLEQCNSVPCLGRVILTWLGIHHRGKPRPKIAEMINKLSPLTAENIVRVFIASLAPTLRTRVETVFNWVKNAAEPWSPESLTEALAVYESDGGRQPSFEDVDAEGTMSEIEDALGGIITVKDGDVRFSHPSFYGVPEVGFEESGEEATAKANSTMAETCLRYFQLRCAQETLAQLSRDNLTLEDIPSPWETPLESAVISLPRTSMADGPFKPKLKELVDNLFASNGARAGCCVPFWILSNPFSRMQRSYISTLPVLAMLGLEDLLQETVEIQKGQPTFEKDCWFAITEAARAGRKTILHRLLGQVAAVDEAELGLALHWAAAGGDPEIVNVLLDKIPNLEIFHWPDGLMHQAAAAGLTDLLAAMVLAGCGINEVSEDYYGAPPVSIAAWRNQVSTMESLLSSECKPDLTIKDSPGETTLDNAITGLGHPRMVEVMLQGGARVNTDEDASSAILEKAARGCNHKAIDVLIKGFKTETDLNSVDVLRLALVTAAKNGSQESVGVLLHHGADPNAECDGATALYEAVAGNSPGIARLLLTHGPKLDMDKTPEGQLKLLMRAVETGNTELVSLLIDHGGEVNFVDPNAGAFDKTPLAYACAEGHLEIVKLLLAKGANINYTGDASDAPMLSALQRCQVEVAKYLLQDEIVDVKWAASDGTTALHAAILEPSIIPELLRRGAPPDCHSTYYGTPLQIAASTNIPRAIEALLANDPKPECVKCLLKTGANPKPNNKSGRDAADVLLQTIESDSDDALECFRLLLCAPDGICVDRVDEQGRTRLHAIQEKTPVSVVQLLVKANAPLDLQDEDGHSPLSVAVGKGNESVARYLVNQGANVNRRSPGFGSILHLAVGRGDLEIAKFLVDSGADLELVDPEYGESLLYTALGIEESAKMLAMVRYLVDEVKVPVNKPGGAEFGYPIIRAAYLASMNFPYCLWFLKFLIRRNARLDVADSQGRHAVHIAFLVKAGANIDVKDALGRKPIHFAASATWGGCFRYLLGTTFKIDINEVDSDGWTPLMWAAPSGSLYNVEALVERKTDIWARGRGSDAKDEWSALKLFNFCGSLMKEVARLEPEERTRVGPDGETEEWDDEVHKSEEGDSKYNADVGICIRCKSCFVDIQGTQWKCVSCIDDFSLCFKCALHQSTVHNEDHRFEEIGPMYWKEHTGYGDHSDDAVMC